MPRTRMSDALDRRADGVDEDVGVRRHVQGLNGAQQPHRFREQLDGARRLCRLRRALFVHVGMVGTMRQFGQFNRTLSIDHVHI